MAWRGEVEDGLGWGGLVASKSEQREEARLAALERDAARYRWLREHFRFANDSMRELWFDQALEPDDAGVPVDLDQQIDAAMNGANRG